MNHKKIVLIVGAFPSISETFIVNKFIGLIEKGLDVHVVCSRFERKNIEAYPRLYPHIHRIHRLWPQLKVAGAVLFPFLLAISLLVSFTKTVEFFSEGFSLARIKRFYQDAPIMLLRPDIIHFEFGALAIGREYLKDFMGCKMAVSFRGYDLNFSGLENPHYYDEVWKSADAVHCLGEDLWKRAQQRGCPSNKPHYLIPPAIDTDFFKRATPHPNPLPEGEGRVRVLSVGRLEWKKGYEFSLQAIKKLKDQGLKIEYRIIGSGNYLEAIAFCRHQLGLEGEVKLLGSKSAHEIRSEMQWADIFLHSAVSEGFCNAVLEAQAMELPVVCSDAGGLPENVQDDITGFVVPSRNPEAIADKIQLLAESEELSAKMGKSGRERVVLRFRLEDQMNSFQKMYQRIT